MSIKESALNTITALTNSDFVRMVTSAGASRKATLQSIAQHIIESYAGSTLAGSQQSVKSALDGLNSTFDSGTWTPSMPRNTLSDVNARWYRVGNILVVTARFTITESTTGNSYITGASFPVPSGYNRISTTLNGTWHNANDAAGEIGQHNYGGNSAWFSKSGAHLQLPASTYAFTLVGILTKA